MKTAANTSTHVELVSAARDQEAIVANLLQLYAHDFSEFHWVDLAGDGRFVYAELPLYWSEPDRHPFLIKVEGKLAGFVLVKRASDLSGNKKVWDMTEFFVTRGYRRRGIGTQIAHDLWRRFSGTWEVRAMQSNIAGHKFWARAIANFSGKPVHPARIEKDGESWSVFTFESNLAA